MVAAARGRAVVPHGPFPKTPLCWFNRRGAGHFVGVCVCGVGVVVIHGIAIAGRAAALSCRCCLDVLYAHADDGLLEIALLATWLGEFECTG